MRRAFLGIAALALVLVATETASAGPKWGVGIGGGRSYYGGWNSGWGVNYGARIGNNGYLNFSYGNYNPGWGYGYYQRPAYYTGPLPGSPYYYNAVPGGYYTYPSYGYSYSYRRWGW